MCLLGKRGLAQTERLTLLGNLLGEDRYGQHYCLIYKSIRKNQPFWLVYKVLEADI